jgi:type IV secretory pathway VirB10-like protein
MNDTTPDAPRPAPTGSMKRRLPPVIFGGGMLAVLLVTAFVNMRSLPTSQALAAAKTKDKAKEKPATMDVEGPLVSDIAGFQKWLDDQATGSKPQAVTTKDTTAAVATDGDRRAEGGGSEPKDTLHEVLRKREIESRFASSSAFAAAPGPGGLGSRQAPAPASDDNIARDVVREYLANQRGVATGQPSFAEPPPPAAAPITAASTTDADKPTRSPALTHEQGPLYTVRRGHLIPLRLRNRLEVAGGDGAPVIAHTREPVLAHDRQHVLIPAGTKVMGATKSVQNNGDSRLGIAFDLLEFEDGSTQTLDQFKALSLAGSEGLKDKMNRHYLSTFGVAAAVGLLQAIPSAVASRGLGGDGDNRTTVVLGDMTTNTSQSMSQVFQRLSNRPIEHTITEGHAFTLYVTSDIQLPAHQAR